MSRVFYKRTHKFINPNRTRVRFYDKHFRRYYTIWITGTYIKVKPKDVNILMCKSLRNTYANKRILDYKSTIIDMDYTWEIV